MAEDDRLPCRWEGVRPDRHSGITDVIRSLVLLSVFLVIFGLVLTPLSVAGSHLDVIAVEPTDDLLETTSGADVTIEFEVANTVSYQPVIGANLTITSHADEIEPIGDESVAIAALEPMEETTVSVPIHVSRTADAGPYTISVAVIDQEGNVHDTATATVTVVRTDGEGALVDGEESSVDGTATESDRTADSKDSVGDDRTWLERLFDSVRSFFSTLFSIDSLR